MVVSDCGGDDGHDIRRSRGAGGVCAAACPTRAARGAGPYKGSKCARLDAMKWNTAWRRCIPGTDVVLFAGRGWGDLPEGARSTGRCRTRKWTRGARPFYPSGGAGNPGGARGAITACSRAACTEHAPAGTDRRLAVAIDGCPFWRLLYVHPITTLQLLRARTCPSCSVDEGRMQSVRQVGPYACGSKGSWCRPAPTIGARRVGCRDIRGTRSKMDGRDHLAAPDLCDDDLPEAFLAFQTAAGATAVARHRRDHCRRNLLGVRRERQYRQHSAGSERPMNRSTFLV